jgi:cyclophilin family peptidyl-prolyl cis-trans isomerase
VLAQLSEAYPNDLRIVVRDLPLTSIHSNAQMASQATQAAGLQNQFFAMHDALFTEQSTWSQMSSSDFTAYLTNLAGELGMDVAQFTADLTSDAVVKKVNDGVAAFEKTGLQYSTPNLIINNIPYGGRNDLDSLKGLVELIMLPDKAFTACPPTVITTGKTYTAVLKTTRGDVTIELFADKAPTTVNSFIYLAQQGWFDNVPFHRVISGFVAQTGDPSGTGMGSPGYAYGVEIVPGLGFDEAGVVGMARGAEPNSNGSQFFITLAPVTDLSGQYTVFGKVTSGMDVVAQITPRDPSRDQVLAEPDLILSVTITEN